MIPRVLLVALAAVLAVPALVAAGTITISWDPAPTAGSYDIEESENPQTVAWKLTKNVPASACTGTPARCTTTVTYSGAGVVHYRYGARNANGVLIRFGEGIWHCPSCTPPPLVQNVGVQ